MVFNSFYYLVFLSILLILIQVTAKRYHWILLLCASWFFYAALHQIPLLIALFWVILVSYFAGLGVGAAPTNRKKIWLWSGIAANLLLLFYLKYLPFLTETVNSMFHLKIPKVTVFTTIGVSYFVFQAVSYLIDVYLEIEKPEKHLGYFALYLSFFPKLLQGPIERASDFLPQINRHPWQFQYDNVRVGILMIVWGLFKKVAVADVLALLVNSVFDNVHAFTGLPLLLATYFYALQIYFDFSSYTDIALGSVLLFNIKLTDNFNRPYYAVSIAEFWRRWHISFSRWILDYIFKPLQMQFRDWGIWGTASALIITFLISGIWHGAGWGFIIWGLLHGFYLAASVFYKPYQTAIHKKLQVKNTPILRVWQILVTFHLVCFAWIFFRAPSISDAWYIITHIFPLFPVDVLSRIPNPSLLLVFILLGIFLMMGIEILKKERPIWDMILNSRRGIRWTIYYVLVTILLLFWNIGVPQYIYFQF